MVLLRTFLVVLLGFILMVDGQRSVRKRGKFKSRNQDKKICAERPLNVNFRKEGDVERENCKRYYKCTSRTKAIQQGCADPLVFDVDLQTCNYAERVDNCNRTDKVEVCRDDGLDQPDCLRIVEKTEDEETIEETKKRENECDLSRCVLPECFCSIDGTAAPGVGGEIQDITDLPMMISISFNGAVNGDNMEIYQKIFDQTNRVNPNGCGVKGTFFVSHKYTNYSAVQELHRVGHEIGVFSITSKSDPEYWSEGNMTTWAKEMNGNRAITERFANITDYSVIGVRAPMLKVGGNEQFRMMNSSFYLYDSSITVPLSDKPVWPYTLDFRVPHPCHNNNCPTESFPLWELPINELDRRDDPNFDEQLTGCQLVSSCTNIQERSQLRTLLEHNFKRHYQSNRAPLTLAFNPSWLISNKGFTDEISDWMDRTLAANNDVYFLTGAQILNWMTKPTANLDLKDFTEWKDKCQVGGQPACSRPNTCRTQSRELPGETNRLFTCIECPKYYPWLRDPEGDGAF